MPSKFSRLFHFQFFLNINPALVEVLIEVFGFILDYVIRVMIISSVIAFYNCSCVINKEVFFFSKALSCRMLHARSNCLRDASTRDKPTNARPKLENVFIMSRNVYFKGFLFPLGSVLVAGMCEKRSYREFRSNTSVIWRRQLKGQCPDYTHARASSVFSSKDNRAVKTRFPSGPHRRRGLVVHILK